MLHDLLERNSRDTDFASRSIDVKQTLSSWSETRTWRKEVVFYRRTAHFDIYKVHTPTNAHFIKFDEVSKFTLKIGVTIPETV